MADLDLDAIGTVAIVWRANGADGTADAIEALVAEVRRLRAEVEAAEATVEEAADDLHHFMQERDRLQAVLVDIAAAVPAAHRNDGRDVPERIREGAAAEAEVRRLRVERDAWKLLADARAGMLAAYRTGSQPSASAWRKVDEARSALAALEADRG